jgi:hypothetical protein
MLYLPRLFIESDIGLKFAGILVPGTVKDILRNYESLLTVPGTLFLIRPYFL